MASLLRIVRGIACFGLILGVGVGSMTGCGGATASVGPDPDPTGNDAGPTAHDAAADHVVPPPGEDSGPHGRVPRKHRPSAVACSHDRAPGSLPGGNGGTGNGPPSNVDGGSGGCVSDADCTHGTNGRCTASGGWGYRACTYDACFADSDCGPGSTCACGEGSPTRVGANLCTTGDCIVDADCGANGYCSPTLDMSDCSTKAGGYYCHSPSDTCIDDEDCPQGDICNRDPAIGHFACTPPVICAG